MGAIDFLHKEGAQILAAKIQAYWADQGQSVMTYVEPVYSDAGRLLCYGVRSDLRAGLPK